MLYIVKFTKADGKEEYVLTQGRLPLEIPRAEGVQVEIITDIEKVLREKFGGAIPMLGMSMPIKANFEVSDAVRSIRNSVLKEAVWT